MHIDFTFRNINHINIDSYFYPEFTEHIKKLPKIHKIELHSLKSLVTHELDEIRGLKYSYILKNYSRLFKYTDAEWIAICNGGTSQADLNRSRSIKARYSHPFNWAIILIMKWIVHPSNSDISAFNIWDKQLIIGSKTSKISISIFRYCNG